MIPAALRDAPLTWATYDGTLVVVRDTEECPVCHRAAAFFLVQADGTFCCLVCNRRRG